MNATEVDIRSGIESKLRQVEEAVRELDAEIARMQAELDKDIHRLEVMKEFYRLEFGDIASAEPVSNESPLFTMPKRFENVTIREACRQILRGTGGMHAGEIALAIMDGGRSVSVTSVTSVLVRGEEFGRVAGKANTFYLEGI